MTDVTDVSTTSTTTAETVVLRLPADPAYVVLVRTAAAGLAARLDLTIDELEDLRLAVDEACGLLVEDAVEGTDLTCAFALDRGLHVTVSARTRSGRAPSTGGFAWAVLAALADTVEATADDDGVVTIAMHKRRAR